MGLRKTGWDGKVPRWIEPRYIGLLFASLGCLLFGTAYTPLSNVPAQLPPGLTILADYVPIWVFGGLWLLTGVAGVVTIVARRRGPIVFAGMVSMYTLWTAAYTAGWILGNERGWVAAGIFLVMLGMVYSFTRVDPPLWMLRFGNRWTRT